ncbi:LysR family transcriptional regulator [Candidatus Epulonipiscium fishelsonii]|uniref:LysR family transcriptional regulator n=1 Tax=Candidatus Epulonipiscium fishelsonii TaxID=77094 RepID=A0ACC8XBG7_9FIRM|nr:LysR family transcriptional regulator [Epulopiscium sp. SCG-B11WGA-EpuloA1]ONI43444.1 LysR family transcriptional regulator [Epulopiscium sp. SCG-B05WGA-EpuloA1]
MNNKDLLYIKIIAEEKSLSKAAKKLYLSQPSLSQVVKKLEDNLATALFKRTSTGLVLTPAGEKYYIFAVQTLKMYDEFLTEISYLDELKKGSINIGITNHLATSILPSVIPKFKSLYPDIELLIKEKNSIELEKSLLSGEIDFSIMHAPQAKNNLQIHYDPLSKDIFLLAMDKDNEVLNQAKMSSGPYPVLDIKCCKDQNFILMDKDQRIRQISDNIFAKASFAPNIIFTLKNFETAKRLAAQGLGITFIPQFYVSIYDSTFSPTYVQIEEQYDPYWITCIATVKDRFVSKADKIFISMVKELFY